MLASALVLTSTEAAAEIPYADAITPGQLRGIALTVDSPWPASYWEYLPSNFETVPEDHLYPMLITLGGIGTMDNGSVCPDATPTCTVAQCEAAPSVDGLCRVYRRGPAVEMRQGVWDDEARPFIVIQPQNRAPTNSTQDYDRDELDALVQFVIENYPVDPRRLFILGNSQGGRAVLQYIAVYNRRMAAATIGPGGLIAENDVGCRIEDTALWAFHGEDDQDTNIAAGAFNPCWVARQVHRASEPDFYADDNDLCLARLDHPFPQARITMFENTAHNAWTPAFENVATGFVRSAWSMDAGGCGFETNWVSYDPLEYGDGVYTWLLEHDRPSVDAGPDMTIPGDAESFDIVAEIVDDDDVTITWTQLDGPPATLTPAAPGTLTVSGFDDDAIYTFEVFVTDADDQWSRDEVLVTVDPEIIDQGSSSGSSSGDGGSTSKGEGSSATAGSTTSDTDTDATGGSAGSSGTTSPGSATGTSTSAGGSASASDTGVPAGDDGAAGSTTRADTDTDADGGATASGGCRVGGEPPWTLALFGLLGAMRRRRDQTPATGVHTC